MLGLDQHRVDLVTDHEHPRSLPLTPSAATRAARPPRSGRRPQPPRAQYVELKAQRPSQAAQPAEPRGAGAGRPRARRERDPHAASASCSPKRARRSASSEREALFGELARRGVRPRAARAAAARPDASATSSSTPTSTCSSSATACSSACRPTFQDDRHLLRVIDRIVSGVGRRIDDSSPMVDARLPDGSRVNAIIPPLAVDGPLLSIRRFPAERLKADDLVDAAAR